MKISVAMATFNGAEYIQEQLASLAAQVSLPYELVVRDDGSSDDTIEIVRSFSKTAPFPVLILPTDERLGFDGNFLRVARACSGDFIACCDQDDIWLANKLAVCGQRLEHDNSLIVLHAMTLIDRTGAVVGEWTQNIQDDRVYEALEYDPYIEGWGNSMVFAKELVHLFSPEVRPRQPESPERTLSHDTWIYILASALGRVSHITMRLTLYRQHNSNVSGQVHLPAQGPLRNLFNFHVVRWREHAKINIAMAALFDELKTRDDPLSEAAAKAGSLFKSRASLLTLRAEIFDGATTMDRLHAFRMFNKQSQQVPTFASNAKAFALGVSGVRQRLQRVWRPTR